jgi:hypothetical protein
MSCKIFSTRPVHKKTKPITHVVQMLRKLHVSMQVMSPTCFAGGRYSPQEMLVQKSSQSINFKARGIQETMTLCIDCLPVAASA